MTETVDCRTAAARLRGADKVLILCHKNPDGDTVGSAGALCKALQSLGRTAAVLCSDPIPKMYDYMNIATFDGSFTPAFVVAVDVASIQLFGEKNNVQDYAAHVQLCIDHHSSNSGYAYETLVDGTASATCELLVELLDELAVPITPEIAACLYTGIATDTGCFRFASTSARTHKAAARVIEAGADVAMLNARLFESRSHGRMEAERMAMEKDGSFKISVRTSGEIDACAIARRLGGGGHSRAAGCEISGNLDNAKHAILEEVRKELERHDLAKSEPTEQQG